MQIACKVHSYAIGRLSERINWNNPRIKNASDMTIMLLWDPKAQRAFENSPNGDGAIEPSDNDIVITIIPSYGSITALCIITS